MSTKHIHIQTIGFTRKSAESFFGALHKAGTRRILDIRRHNTSQLAGFTKQDDLAYFLRALLGIEYLHLAILAPTQEVMDAYKKRHGEWSVFEKAFLKLMKEREIEKKLDPAVMDRGCLLCSEDEPEHCHRRLVAEYLQQRWGGAKVKIEHL